jgi:RHS repeat-associated protein
MSGQTVGERNATSGAANDYVFGPGIDEPLGKRAANGSITYFGADGLGSIVVATDSIGSILRSNGYSPWGETASVPPELFGYTGRETGGPSWYYRARHYDASHGRFLSEDPIGEGFNHYAYVFNDPIDSMDPTGLKVYRCCAVADIPGNVVHASHCWLKTSTREAGLGGIDVGQPAKKAVPNNGCGPHDGPFAQTQIVDHSGESVSRAGTRCEEIPDVDEKCVDDAIFTDSRGYGATKGLWSPWNQCNSVANGILSKCRKRPCLQRPPSPPSDDGRRYF